MNQKLKYLVYVMTVLQLVAAESAVQNTIDAGK
jgi:hypothetical protein